MDQFIKIAGTEGKVGGFFFAGCRLLTKTLNCINFIYTVPGQVN